MRLTIARTWSADRDEDWTIRCDGVPVGRLREQPPFMPGKAWTYEVTLVAADGPLRRGAAETLTEAKAAWRAAWDALLEHAGADEISRAVERARLTDRRLEEWARRFGPKRA